MTTISSLDAACIRGVPGALEPLALPAGPAWDAFFAAAFDERAIPFVAAAVDAGFLLASPQQRDALATAHENVMRACLVLERATLDVADVFHRAGVTFRLLKGPAVARLDYPDPAWRGFSDVDVLVRSSEYEAATRALCAIGATRRSAEMRPGFDRRFGKGVCMYLPGGVQVDVHRTLVSGPFGLTVALDRLFDADDTVRLGGRALPVLTREHRFVHACFHAVLGDATPRLVALRDVVQLLLATDLDFVIARTAANEWRSGAVVACAISEAFDRFGIDDVPASEWASRYVPSRFERRALAAYRGPNRSYARQMVAGVPALPGVAAKVAYVRSLLFVDAAYADRHGGGFGRRFQRAWKSRVTREHAT